MVIRKAHSEDKLFHTKLAMYSYNPPENVREILDKKFEFYTNQYYSVEEQGTIIGRARLIPFEQSIRGSWKRMGGIASVASAPDSRRRGHIRNLMHFLLEEMHDENTAISTLYPFKEEFYARFGYVSSHPFQRVQMRTDGMRIWEVPDDYSISTISLTEGIEHAKRIHSDSIGEIHGTVRRSDARWNEHLMTADDHCAFVLRGMTPVAYMRYRMEGYGSFTAGDRDGKMYLSEMFWSDVNARNLLLNYIYGHADQIVIVRIPIAPINQDYWFWTKRFNVGETKLEANGVHMARIVDVDRCLSDIPAPREGCITVEVKDQFCDWNNGTYELVSDGAILHVMRPASKEHDAKLSIEGLTALVYGTGSIDSLMSLGWLRGGKLEVLESWFPPMLPWFTEDF